VSGESSWSMPVDNSSGGASNKIKKQT